MSKSEKCGKTDVLGALNDDQIINENFVRVSPNRLRKYWMAIFIATSTATDPDSVKNTRDNVPGVMSARREARR